MNNKSKKLMLITILVTLLFIITGCSSNTAQEDNTHTKDESKTNMEQGSTKEGEKEEESNKEEGDVTGGELRVALSTPPATLDQPTSTDTSARDVSRLIFETLLTVNSKYQPVPMLAESFDVSDDGKTYTFHLREGVKFHNGKEMTADDVVASMYRWLEKSTITGAIFNDATFEAKDDYTVVLELIQPSALTLDVLASTKMAAAIMPKEIVESATEDGVTEYIGTGPYKFVEWKTDHYVHLAKFDDYQPLDEEADGLAGKKQALADDIYFDIVSDPATRLAGLQTGEYDIAYAMPNDNYQLLVDDPNLEPVLEETAEFVLIYNKAEGLASNFKMRQAINTGIDINEIMMSAFTNEDIYSLQSGYMMDKIENWASDAGNEFYNINDQEKAKELLEEAGYNGEEFTLITTRVYPHFYNASVVLQEQLTNLGMNVKLEVYDWAGLSEKRDNPSEWDAYINGLTTVTTPTQLLHISPTYSGGVQNEKIVDLTEQIATANTLEEAKKIWDEVQGYAWEHHLPVTTLGAYSTLYAQTSKVSGFTNLDGGIYWNVAVEE